MQFLFKAPHPFTSLVFGLGFVFFLYAMPPLLMISDVPRHIASGEYILTHHEFTKTDPWSFTAHAMPWYNLAWGWDVLLAESLRTLGFQGMQILIALLGALSISQLTRNLINRNQAGTEALTVLLMCVAALFINSLISARPQIISVILALNFYHILHISKERGGKYLLALPPISLVWANMHGGVMIAITLLGAYVIEALVERKWRRFSSLVIVSAGCVIAISVNPYGWAIFNAVWITLGSAAQQYIMEFKPFNIRVAPQVAVWVLGLLIVSDFKDKNTPLSDRIVAAMWLFATFLSIRHITILVVVSSPYFAYHLQRFLSGVSKISKENPVMPAASAKKSAISFALSLGFTVFIIASPVKNLLQPPAYAAQSIETKDVLEFIRLHYPEARFFNQYTLGSYLIWDSKGTYPVFIDDRAETAYPDSIIEDYYTIINLKPGWKGLLKKHAIEGFIVPNKGYDDFIAGLEEYGHGIITKAYSGIDADLYIYHPQ